MPLPKQPTVTATTIGRITISVASVDAVTQPKAMVDFDRVDAQGGIINTQQPIDLIPHLTAAQISALTALMNALRTKAMAEAV